MKMVVGLGNPGPSYERTRHNVGFLVLMQLAERAHISYDKMMCQSKVGSGLIGGEAVRLVLPQTFMNSSGEAVASLVHKWKCMSSDLLVVCDDIALPLGSLRLRGQGSDGGHHGLASILAVLGTRAVPRLRVGIGSKPVPAGQDLTPYVLSSFRPSEKKRVGNALERAACACENWIEHGLSYTMNFFNKKGDS